ncbi:MAG: RNA polymerase sigma factor [Planctomycetota bacterium]
MAPIVHTDSAPAFPDGVFPDTPWSDLHTPASDTRRREMLTELCQAYWRPVFSLVRARGARLDDALDLTQEFFCSLLNGEGQFLDRYDAGRGRFRTFLKGAVRKFLAQDYRDRKRDKRGGSAIIISLDALGDAGSDDADMPGHGETPEDLFDRRWAETVMAHALERLQTELTAAGKVTTFHIFVAYDLERAGGANVRYEDIAAEFGLSRDDVKNQLTRARSQLRQILLSIVSRTAATSDDAVQECDDLFSGVMREDEG